jgi:hypothetical protein
MRYYQITYFEGSLAKLTIAKYIESVQSLKKASRIALDERTYLR